MTGSTHLILLICNTLFNKIEQMEFLNEFWLFLRTRKRYWLLPLMLLLLLLGALSIFTAGSALAPFIYSLF